MEEAVGDLEAKTDKGDKAVVENEEETTEEKPRWDEIVIDIDTASLGEDGGQSRRVGRQRSKTFRGQQRCDGMEPTNGQTTTAAD